MVAAVFLVLPLVSLVWATPWHSFVAALTNQQARQALWLSALTSVLSTLACLVLGLPLAWVLARTSFRGRRLLRGLVAVPMVLPPVVAGVALLTAFGRVGLLGTPLYQEYGITIPFTTFAVVLAHTFVSLPFLVLSAESGLRAVPTDLEQAASALGAGRWMVFRRVSLPLALPGIGAGMVLAWARSVGEFGATITFAGNYQGTTQTMPLDVYTQLQGNVDSAKALSLVLLAVCVLVLVLLRERWLGVR